MSFVHLRVHTAWSLAEGAIRTKWLAETCRAENMPAVAVTDSNNLYGAMESAQVLSDSGIQPIVGAELSFLSSFSRQKDEPTHRLVLLAASEVGYHNLIQLVTAAHFADPPTAYPGLEPHLHMADLTTDMTAGLICLTGGHSGALHAAFSAGQIEQGTEFARDLQGIFSDRLYLEINRFPDFVEPTDETAEQEILNLAAALKLPIVAANNCMFPKPEMYEAHDALLCITGDYRVSETMRPRASRYQYLRTPQEMAALFSDLPDALENTVEIARRCHWWPSPVKTLLLPSFQIKETGAKESQETEETKESEDEALIRMARSGLEMRITASVFTPDMSDSEKEETRRLYFERLEVECGVIIDMKYSGYFLIVADFIGWALRQGIPVGPGRGSGVGSVVAWALRITNLDPIKYGLLFERFLNRERVSMPDFDIDFCQQRRDEVLGYVRDRYGARQVAQIATFGSLQAKAVVRDLGRVLELPGGLVNTLANLIPFRAQPPVTLDEAINDVSKLQEHIDTDPDVRRLFDMARKLEGLYRHSSTHAAGVVIGDRPLEELVPLTRDPKTGAAATQYNMKWVEKAGLVKFDFLGLKTLSVIEMAIRLAKQHSGASLDLEANDIPINDRTALDLMQEAETVGVFQFESDGMRRLLRQIQINGLEELIALVSLYRPGPMQNIPAYVENSAKVARGEKISSIHPLLDAALAETHGIMIYQEQVLQAVRDLAGYSLGEADILRRAMGKKIASEMTAQLTKFTEGAKAKSQISEAEAKRIFETIEKFAGYGFNKSHAAAYAVMSAQTAWLKAHHPHAFYAASMSFDLQSTDRLAIFANDMKRREFVLLPPDINKSQSLFSIEIHDGKPAVRYALAAIKGIGEGVAQAIEIARAEGGDFTDVFNLCERVQSDQISKRVIEPLAASGALDAISPSRGAIYQAAEMLSRYAQSCTQDRESGLGNLFEGDESAQAPPPLPKSPAWSDQERHEAELVALGFYLTGHPLDEMQDSLREAGVCQLGEFHRPEPPRHKGGSCIAARVEAVRPIVRGGRRGSLFIVTLSDPSGVLEARLHEEDLQLSGSITAEALQKGLQVAALMTCSDEGGGDQGMERRFNLLRVLPLEQLDAVAPRRTAFRRSTDGGRKPNAHLQSVAEAPNLLRESAKRQATENLTTENLTTENLTNENQNSENQSREKQANQSHNVEGHSAPCRVFHLVPNTADASRLAAWLSERQVKQNGAMQDSEGLRSSTYRHSTECSVIIEINFNDAGRVQLALPGMFQIAPDELASH